MGEKAVSPSGKFRFKQLAGIGEAVKFGFQNTEPPPRFTCTPALRRMPRRRLARPGILLLTPAATGEGLAGRAGVNVRVFPGGRILPCLAGLGVRGDQDATCRQVRMERDAPARGIGDGSRLKGKAGDEAKNRGRRATPQKRELQVKRRFTFRRRILKP